ncbi:hypothetical protein CYLTODRAFT_24229 [Cylindrobasidium torrendii FP15055 ss-10]|uniref:Family A G protein-coupled receptor-like protein n=1 Tax=Cylindrobasidium torrendii FP15055 ss-10 TaxID=1314674 RepID=A0A0D7B8C5_9AGAR|nr:hypothetical protein CYLTODRAFT_24229 [Cylindrobasidium torrendii FP15055 ss-10]
MPVAIAGNEWEKATGALVGVLSSTAFWTCNIVLFVLSTKIQLRRKVDSWPKVLIFLATVALLVLSSAGAAIRAARLFLEFTMVLREGSKVAASTFKSVDGQLNAFYHFVGNISWLIGDCIVLWRAEALFRDEPPRLRAMLLLPVLAMLIPNRVVYGLSFLATMMMAWKAWRHRRLLRTSLGASHRKTLVERVTLIFLESGAVYICMYIVRTIGWIAVSSPASPFALFVNIVAPGIDQICCLHPAAVIILVNTNRSMVEDGEFSVHIVSQGPETESMLFARRPSHTNEILFARHGGHKRGGSELGLLFSGDDSEDSPSPGMDNVGKMFPRYVQTPNSSPGLGPVIFPRHAAVRVGSETPGSPSYSISGLSSHSRRGSVI